VVLFTIEAFVSISRRNAHPDTGRCRQPKCNAYGFIITDKFWTVPNRIFSGLRIVGKSSQRWSAVSRFYLPWRIICFFTIVHLTELIFLNKA
jgi:hypothetical protein